MTRTLFILLAGLILLQACKSDSSKVEVGNPLPEYKVFEDRKLVALFDNSTFSYYIYRGRPMGFEFEILSAFTKDMDLDLEVRIESHIETVFSDLENLKGEIIAYNLTVTKERKGLIDFSNSYLRTRQVLVQRKPEKWRTMRHSTLERNLIRSVLDLEGKEVLVRANSAFVNRLHNLSEEIGAEIIVVEALSDDNVETLVRRVSEGGIDYTICDENMARILVADYPNLDVSTPISFEQKIAFGLNKGSGELRDSLNLWLARNEMLLAVLRSKYFASKSRHRRTVSSKYFSDSSGVISAYDGLIREQAERLGWDWRLLASLIYQESRFDPNAESWAGAKGLMQLTSATAERFGLDTNTDSYSVSANLRAGTNFLMYLKRYWQKQGLDSSQVPLFTMASYNAGLGHVLDAQRLCEKYGNDSGVWQGEVEEFLLKKSIRKYYRDPVVKLGYARGTETVHYVQNIISGYHHYLNKLPGD